LDRCTWERGKLIDRAIRRAILAPAAMRINSLWVNPTLGPLGVDASVSNPVPQLKRDSRVPRDRGITHGVQLASALTGHARVKGEAPQCSIILSAGETDTAAEL
jgi:hypothetical protein